MSHQRQNHEAFVGTHQHTEEKMSTEIRAPQPAAEEEVVEESPRNPSHFSAGSQVVMGIDEAGRGPVLGPMVYAGFVCPVDFEAHLKRLGFADSKTLKEEKRDDLFALARRDGRMAWFVRSLSPELLSRSMQARTRINLNTLSHEAAASLVAKAIASGLAVQRLLVDTVGDPSRYRQYLEKRFPSIPEVIVAAKADATFGPVSAASIVAKVTRDSLLRHWQFREHGVRCGTDFGSGYPSDPATQKWLRNSIDPVFGFPSVMRFSWK